MNDISAAYLWAQLQTADKINNNRLASWNLYYKLLKLLEAEGKITLSTIPDNCNHNAHMFYIKVKNLNERTALIKYLKTNNIMAIFHYIPLHTSAAGRKYGIFNDEDKYTTKESEKIVRLPLYYEICHDEIRHIASIIYNYFS